MGKNEKLVIKVFFVLLNVLILGVLFYLLSLGYIIFEVFMAIVFIQMLANAFLAFLYFLHKKIKTLAHELGFEFLTRYLEQPRMEGVYKKNWFQVHYASRSYSEYWGMPRTYIKLQFKEERKYDEAKLKKYENYKIEGFNLTSIEHVTRPYKNYLLMKVDWYVFSKKNVEKLMDLLIKIEKEAKLK